VGHLPLFYGSFTVRTVKNLVAPPFFFFLTPLFFFSLGRNYASIGEKMASVSVGTALALFEALFFLSSPKNSFSLPFSLGAIVVALS